MALARHPECPAAGPPQPAAVEIGSRAIAAHLIYANEKRHVVEVGADDEEHLVGWLSNRLGTELKAPDFSAEGYSLVGGRLQIHALLGHGAQVRAEVPVEPFPAAVAT